MTAGIVVVRCSSDQRAPWRTMVIPPHPSRARNTKLTSVISGPVEDVARRGRGAPQFGQAVTTWLTIV